MKISSGLSLLLVLFLYTACLAELAAPENPTKEIFINGVRIKAEVVHTPEKIYQGLSGRKALPEGHGMLFVMPALECQHFCMRGMLFPIDIIWIANTRIIGLAQHLSPQDNGTFSSPAPANYVLEVSAGFCDKHRIEINDTIFFK
ncbi:MAG: DUF192 domain-containing protein [Deltaproteobacteria bacterium]|nr:DUF192 domain-containing protein [Deltaproteobacteria bacterium]MBW1987472.1 DUF192 domain-containing protein [Deltaproteobacteria bacterium]MBW2135327.1 DUF192 domain-containing protein [Deltaproteobacteria bacterium]